MKSQKNSVLLTKPKLSSAVIAALFLVLITVIYLVTHAVLVERSKEAAGRELSAIVRTAVTSFPSAQFHRLYFEKVQDLGEKKYRKAVADASNSKEFANLKLYLGRVIHSQKSINFDANNVYVFTKDRFKDDSLLWAVMTHKKPFTGELYEVRPEMKPVLSGRAEYAVTDIYLSSASARRWISAYAPVKHQGEVIGIMEAAYDIEAILEQTTTDARQALAMAVVLLLVALAVMFFIYRLLNKLWHTNRRLESAISQIEKSEKRYRRLTESSDDIILQLDFDFKVMHANNALRTHLGLSAKDLEGRPITAVYFNPEDYQQQIDQSILSSNMQSFLKQCREKGVDGSGNAETETVINEFSISFYHKVTGEPKEFKIKVQAAAGQIIFKAAHILQDNLARSTVAEKVTFRLENYLLLAESVSQKIAGQLATFCESSLVRDMRVSLREMLINAIEHGNLNITFDEKTQAQIHGTYLDLIQERRNDSRYSERRVTVEYLINSKKCAVRITDEGEGFDYNKMGSDEQAEEANEQMLMHGRGIRMTRTVFDIVRYKDPGNQVTLIKQFAPAPEEDGADKKTEESDRAFSVA